MVDRRVLPVLLALVALMTTFRHQTCDAACGCGLKNVALGRTATHSSTLVGFDFVPSADLAVDGDSDSVMNSLTCTHTGDPGNGRSWWQVDLGVRYNVTSVTITNRGDCCGGRLHDFDVDVFRLNPENKNNSAAKAVAVNCHHHTGPMGQGATITFPCSNAPIRGRFVRITNAVREVLHLCEVAVNAWVGE